MVALPAITLAAGAGTVDWGLYPWTEEIRLSNQSAFVLTLSIGGTQHILDPYTADRYRVRDVRSLKYQASASVTPAVTGTLLLQLADLPGERIPGVYPMHLR